MSGFYYVKAPDSPVMECRARGRLKKENIKPVVGDKVVIQKLSPTSGVLEEVKERKNHLIRPSVSNIDQLCIVFAATNPTPDFLLVDRLSVLAEKNNIDVLICITKIDLDTEGVLESVKTRFAGTDYTVLGISNKTLTGFDELKEKLTGKISTLSGPSGVGKSTLVNNLNPAFNLAVSSVSEKTKRGKHTTTYCELLEVMENSFVVDTPGFTSLELKHMDIYELSKHFDDFRPYLNCRYTSCVHVKEEECRIKEAVDKGLINSERYNNYLLLHKEIRENEVKY